jgi:hypothetical protein
MVNKPSEVFGKLFGQKNIPFDLFAQRGPFIPGHLVAGGRLRMEKEVFIKQDILNSEKWQGAGPVNWVVSALEQMR